MDNFLEKQSEFVSAGIPFVCVTLVDAVGSTPQEAGAKMLVTARGLATGTVGGGKVEAKALELALELLNASARSAPTRFVDWALQKDVGMTCGGRVKLFFERMDPEAWNIALFGAGHVALALARILATLECRVRCYDPRPEWLARLPVAGNIEAVHCAEGREIIATLPGDCFVLCLTRGHTGDLPILAEALRHDPPFPYLGVIGSKSKRAVLERELADLGVPPERRGDFFCPVGLPFGDNRPEEIAISIVAQLLETRDRLRAAHKNPAS